MNRVVRRLHRAVATRRVGKFVDGNGKYELQKLGTSHGGWIVPVELMTRGATAICVGAGEDISFDVELNKRGMNVVSLDPTPRAKRHVEEVLAGAERGETVAIKSNSSEEQNYKLQGFEAGRFLFRDIGVWKEEATLKFFAPENKEHVSHSIVNLQKTTEYFEARCMRLGKVCEELGVENAHLVKMDIEGAEYEVVKNVVEEGPHPKVMCVEFDEIRNPLDSNYLKRIEATVNLLKGAGYRFLRLEDSNALFVKEQELWAAGCEEEVA